MSDMLFFLKTIKNGEKIGSVVTFRMKMYSLGLYDLFIIVLIRFSILSRLGIRVNKMNYCIVFRIDCFRFIVYNKGA